MRICKCGAKITQHELTGNREAWHCRGCGRYEAISRLVNQNDIMHSSSGATQDKYEGHSLMRYPERD